MKWKIEPIFPSPLYIGEDLNITDDEINYVKSCSTIPLNHGNNIVSKDDHILDKIPILKSEIQKHLKKYLDIILCPAEPIELVLTQSWLNENNTDSFRAPHIHTNSFLSGVVYISDYLTPITFHKNIQQINWLDIEPSNFNEYNSFRFTQDVTKNMLLIFPSNMQHSVEINESSNQRLSIAFNTFIKGTIGVKERMTILEIK